MYNNQIQDILNPKTNEKYFTDAHKKIYFINQYFDDVIYLSSINIE